MKKVHIWISFTTLFIIIAGFFLFRPYYIFLTQTLNISPFKALISNKELKTINNSINILILGIPGGNHDGPNLSDSINVVHYDLISNKITIIGIPRDIWSDTLQDKINSAYSYGEAKKKGGGLKLAKAEVSGIVGLPISYGVVISFDKFRDLINYLGGINVQVEHSFTDYDFPITGHENDLCNGDPDYRCRYETLTFKKGITHMDGETALKFVRSRHATGEEGSDFARNHRQQIIMDAVKNSILQKIKSVNVDTYSNLYSELNKLVERDINNQEAIIIIRNALYKKNLIQKNFPLPMDLFEVPEYEKYYGKYVLIPKENNSQIIKNYVQCIINKGDEKLCDDV